MSPVATPEPTSGKKMYRIVHELGVGSYSTVWPAKDLEKDRFVALKLIIASASLETPETCILRHLAASNSSHPGRCYVANLLEDFKIQGPNGTHRCLVTEVGPSLSKIKLEPSGNKLPVPIAKRVASQCTQALAFIHSSGVARGGCRYVDFHPGNILFTIPDFHSWTIEKVYKQFGKPYKEPVERVDGAPLTPAAPRYVVTPTNPLRLAKIVMKADYQSHRFWQMFVDVITPKVDAWSLTCMMCEVLGNHKLLESFFAERGEILVEMVRTFGKFPECWWKQWDERSTFFEEDGAFKADSGDHTGEPRTVNLKERLKDIRREDDEGHRELGTDLDALERVLERLLKYEPEERARIEDISLPF
ncbi:hypothetical protein H0H81_009414 [Sphagnurus paluster]|uniref:non-specific serine/threonine protein kinase n=1 Tax=Sphagnurus paluster TaxID=117069 RepID=A0A9P7K5C9_9AGAR|nr:hypothetical protein H0H81_009414 [Sphagnurus paluster]